MVVYRLWLSVLTLLDCVFACRVLSVSTVIVFGARHCVRGVPREAVGRLPLLCSAQIVFKYVMCLLLNFQFKSHVNLFSKVKSRSVTRKY